MLVDESSTSLKVGTRILEALSAKQQSAKLLTHIDA